jgi:hypothetical protein
MAKENKTNPTVVVDGVSREMTDEEFSTYNEINSEVEFVIDEKKKQERDRELAVAKFVALGLTEEDLRIMGL